MQIVNIITQYYPSFFKALGITLQMTVISLLCATVLGVIFGLFKVSDFKILKLIADVYIDIIRGGIEAVDKGQMEAARSLGLSYGKAMRKVILPQAFRTMLPSIINQFIISLKDTSLVSVIGPRELTQNGKIIAANSASMVMPIWICVALFYLVVCTILSRIAKYVERRVSYGK